MNDITKKLRPALGRVLVKEIEDEVQKNGALLLDKKAQDRARSLMRGELLALGSKTNANEPVDITGDGSTLEDVLLGAQIGDTVLFVEYSSSEIDVDGVTYRLLRWEDVIGFIKKDHEEEKGDN